MSLTDMDRNERLLDRWKRVELPVGIVLIAAGFLAVFLGWVDASGTVEVHRQLQAMISGGFGGLALVLLGATFVISHVGSTSARQLEGKLDRVADALLDLAFREEDDAARDITAQIREPVVLASNASYHLPECDLVKGREEGMRQVPLSEVAFSDLTACGVCRPRAKMLA